MNNNSKITLQVLADKLGVTKVTISKALREHPDISHATIALVKKTAEELGYIPNFAARNLSARKTNTIGVIIPKVAHSFYPSLTDSIYKYAAEKNYEIILTVSQENPELEKKHIITMISMKVDGIIAAVTNNTKDKNVFHLVLKNEIPMVQIDRTISNKSSKIIFDDTEATFNAVNYAINKGHKSLAFVGGNHRLHVGKARFKGFEKALNNAGIKMENRLIVEGGFTEEVGYSAMMNFHEQKNIPDFIFATTYPIALGVHDAAKRLGLSMHKDLDLISFGDSFFNKYLTPPIKCIFQDTDKMARMAIEEIITQIESQEKLAPITRTVKSVNNYTED